MKTILAVAVLACTLQAERKSNPMFDSMKKLEGAWESTDKDHPCVVTYKPSAGGSILIETMTMPNHAEMVTIYHPEGEGLGMTHYCMLANQPHMKAENEKQGGVLIFVCDGGSNFKCASDKHMHSLVITIVDADHMMQVWTLYDGGKKQGVHSFTLVRRKA